MFKAELFDFVVFMTGKKTKKENYTLGKIAQQYSGLF